MLGQLELNRPRVAILSNRNIHKILQQVLSAMSSPLTLLESQPMVHICLMYRVDIFTETHYTGMANISILALAFHIYNSSSLLDSTQRERLTYQILAGGMILPLIQMITEDMCIIALKLHLKAHMSMQSHRSLNSVHPQGLSR